VRTQAAIVESELNGATTGPPPYDKANRILDFAIENNVPIKQKSIESAKRRVASHYTSPTPGAQESVKITLAQLVRFEAIAAIGEPITVSKAIFVPAGTSVFHAPVFGETGIAILGDGPGRTIILVDFDLEMRFPAAFSIRDELATSSS
jgi:hypothetical protein